VPRRDAASTKYSAGSVLVLGGSTGMLGAPALSGMAALRAGAGIVWLAVQPEHADRIPGLRPELMVRELPAALELTGQAGAIVIGPGLGRSVGALEMSRKLSRRHAGPVVVDADGLFALNGQLEQLARRRLPAVLTPHEGELGRLLERESAWVRANRVAAVREAAARSRAVVLLKGADTLVAAPDGERLLVSVSDAHGLATAGAGDVLSGVIGALLARGLDPLTAAALGACAHGRAGRAAMERHGGDGILAGDVIEALPGVLAGS
jgi:ADP-dependent NAD(P)H-hydrate dehydratase / NAD(P)H-hydrate epimerase